MMKSSRARLAPLMVAGWMAACFGASAIVLGACSGDDAHVDPTVPPPPKDASSDSKADSASDAAHGDTSTSSDAARSDAGASETGADAPPTEASADGKVGDTGSCPPDAGCES